MQEGVAEIMPEVGGYDAKCQAKTKLPWCGSHNDVLGAEHEPAVGGADVANRGEILYLKAYIPDQVALNEIVTRTGVNEGNALDRLNAQFDVHHGRGGQDKGLVGHSAMGRTISSGTGVESGGRRRRA